MLLAVKLRAATEGSMRLGVPRTRRVQSNTEENAKSKQNSVVLSVTPWFFLLLLPLRPLRELF